MTSAAAGSASSSSRGAALHAAARERDDRAQQRAQQRRRAEYAMERAAALAANRPMRTSVPKSWQDKLAWQKKKDTYLAWKTQLESSAMQDERKKIAAELKANPRSPEKPYIPSSRSGGGSSRRGAAALFDQLKAASPKSSRRPAVSGTRRPTTAAADGARGAGAPGTAESLIPHHQVQTVGGCMGGPFNIIGVSSNVGGWERRRGFTFLP